MSENYVNVTLGTKNKHLAISVYEMFKKIKSGVSDSEALKLFEQYGSEVQDFLKRDCSSRQDLEWLMRGCEFEEDLEYAWNVCTHGKKQGFKAWLCNGEGGESEQLNPSELLKYKELKTKAKIELEFMHSDEAPISAMFFKHLFTTIGFEEVEVEFRLEDGDMW